MIRCKFCGNDNDVAKPGYMEVVDHIMRKYQEKKKAKYPFSPSDGKIVKRLIAYYDKESVKALWDVFIAQNDSWTLMVGHKICEFQRQLPKILDGNDWKSLVSKYRTAPAVDIKLKQLRAAGE